jgi:hypothetical protein
MTQTPNAKLRYPEENDTLASLPYHTAMKNMADDIDAMVIRRGDIRTVAELPASPNVGDTFLLRVPWDNTLSEDNAEPNTPVLWPIVYHPQNGYRYTVLGGEDLTFDGSTWFTASMVANGSYLKVNGGGITPRIKIPLAGRWIVGGGVQASHPVNQPGGSCYIAVNIDVAPGERFFTQSGYRPALTTQTQYGKREVVPSAGAYIYLWISNGSGTGSTATLKYCYLTAKPRQIIPI